MCPTHQTANDTAHAAYRAANPNNPLTPLSRGTDGADEEHRYGFRLLA